MQPFPQNIVCCYLYTITRYGYPPPAAGTLQYLEEMKGLGFQSVELEGIRREHLLEVYAMREAVAQKVSALGLKVPYFCAVLPGLSAPDATTRRRNLVLFERGCEVARHLGALGILDNAPLPPYEFPADIPTVRHYEAVHLQGARFPSALEWGSYWRDLVRTYQEACDIAADYGLTYQIHPAEGLLAATTDGFLYFADAIDRPNLRFNFDTANLLAFRENLDLALLRLAPWIDYIHVSDNRGEKVEHLAIGAGRIDWPALINRLKKLGFSGHYGLDIGGAESEVDDLDGAYREGARFLERNL